MLKRMAAWLIVLVLCFGMAAPSFAFDATPSNAQRVDAALLATPADAQVYFEPVNLYDYLDVPSVLSDGDVIFYQNTVDLSKILVRLGYRSTSGLNKSVYTTVDSNGYFSFTKPADFSSSRYVDFDISKCKPPNGKYFFGFAFASNTGGFTYGSTSLGSSLEVENVANQGNSVAMSMTQFSGDFSASCTVDFGNVSYCWVSSTIEGMIPPFGGYLSVRFEKIAPSSAVDGTTAGGSYTSGDAAVDTAQNSAQIASNTASMADTLREIVQTISHQLAALWDQMYNLMHVPQLANDNRNTDRIINKLGDDLNVQIQNDNDNTETIINGYDRSEMDSANQQLDDSITQQEAQEQQIMEQISKPLEDFSFDNPVTQYLSTFRLFGDFLQDLFVNSGAFKDVINLSFIMTIALMCAGLYRFKGGN